jgi:uncharacterized protein
MPTIIFKATEACNSNCIYCDVVTRKQPRTISADLLEKAYIRINEYLIMHPGEDMQIIWHGGEPCMAGIQTYTKALQYQDTHCATTRHRINYAVQSNLTMITQDFIDIFKKMNISSVGTSFEPVPGIRGLGKNRDSALYNKNFFKGVNLLNDNDISWGFIYVVTKRSLSRPLEIFHYLTNLKLRGGFIIHPVLIYNNEDPNQLAITAEEYADFMGVIFDYWWKRQDRFPEVDPFRGYLKNYTTNDRTLACVDSGHCAHSHVYVGPEGNVSHCGRAADWDLIDYGNINDKSLNEIFEDPKRNIFVEREQLLPQSECKSCEYWELCHGGCPLDAWNEHKSFLHKTELCNFKQLFLKKYFEPITGLKLNRTCCTPETEKC